MPLCSVRLLAPGRKHNLRKLSHFSEIFSFCCTRNARTPFLLVNSCLLSLHVRYKLNEFSLLHSFRFNLSRIKFLFLSFFSGSFLNLFYRLMRPLSKVETHRSGSLPFFYLVSFLLLCLCYAIFRYPFYIFHFLKIPCLLLLLLCSYFNNIIK